MLPWCQADVYDYAGCMMVVLLQLENVEWCTKYKLYDAILQHMLSHCRIIRRVSTISKENAHK